MILRSALALVVTVALLPASVRAAPALPDSEPAAVEEAEPEAELEADKPAETRSLEEGPGEVDPMLDSLIEEATRHFKEGRRLYFDGEYAAAAAEFERSYAAIRSGDALRNVVLAHSRAGSPIAAIRAARRYLELPNCGTEGADPIHCAKNRDEIELTLERLLRQVGELRLAVEPGVEIREIRVSGRVVPVEDFPIVLEPGEVDVEVIGTGPDERLFTLVRMRAGKQTPLVVRFDKPADPDAKGGDDRPPPDDGRAELERIERRKRGARTAFWAGLGVTVASGVALGVLGGLTVSRKSRFDNSLADLEDGMGPDEPLADRFYALRRGTNAMIAVTAVTGMATLILGLFAFSPTRRSGARASTHKRFRVTPGGVAVRF